MVSKRRNELIADIFHHAVLFNRVVYTIYIIFGYERLLRPENSGRVLGTTWQSINAKKL